MKFNIFRAKYPKLSSSETLWLSLLRTTPGGQIVPASIQKTLHQKKAAKTKDGVSKITKWGEQILLNQ